MQFCDFIRLSLDCFVFFQLFPLAKVKFHPQIADLRQRVCVHVVQLFDVPLLNLHFLHRLKRTGTDWGHKLPVNVLDFVVLHFKLYHFCVLELNVLVELLPFYVELCMGFSNCDVYLMLKELFLRNIIAQQRLQLCDLTGLCLNLVVQAAYFFLKETLIVVYFIQAIHVKVNCLINFFPLLLSSQTFKNFYL